jgi:hypothetical protein
VCVTRSGIDLGRKIEQPTLSHITTTTFRHNTTGDTTNQRNGQSNAAVRKTRLLGGGGVVYEGSNKDADKLAQEMSIGARQNSVEGETGGGLSNAVGYGGVQIDRIGSEVVQQAHVRVD